MKVELREVPDVPAAWQTTHRVRALAVNGRAEAVDALAEWRTRGGGDYGKIVESLRQAAGKRRVSNPDRVKRDRKRSGVFELRAPRGNARLFYFYSPDANEIIVLTNAYWKTKPSEAEQERAFERARRLMELHKDSTIGNQRREGGS